MTGESALRIGLGSAGEGEEGGETCDMELVWEAAEGEERSPAWEPRSLGWREIAARGMAVKPVGLLSVLDCSSCGRDVSASRQYNSIPSIFILLANPSSRALAHRQSQAACTAHLPLKDSSASRP